MKKYNKGFTILEIVLVIGIMLVLVGVSLPLYSYFQTSSTLGSTKQEVVQNIRYAQSLAQSGAQNSNHGVHFKTNEITLYVGDTYGLSDPATHIVYQIPDHVVFSSSMDLNFTKKTGAPSTTGTITLTDTITGNTIDIVVNATGFVY